ncbi:hypothetical protein [Eubacterium sp.]|uniref:hypothetical protein n=1 Tax=Eubacterium sp. TaxID=142586 RepID=UPI003520290B
MVKALSVFSEDLYEEFDLRPVHILVEFGNVMEKRVNYLLDNGFIKKNKKTDELQKVLQKYIKQCSKSQNLCIRYFFTSDSVWSDRVKEMVITIKPTYKSILELLIDAIEESADIVKQRKDPRDDR